MNNVIKEVIDGINILIDAKIKDLQHNKTIKGIVSYAQGDRYKIKDNDLEYSVKKLSTDLSIYSVGDVVYCSAPNGYVNGLYFEHNISNANRNNCDAPKGNHFPYVNDLSKRSEKLPLGISQYPEGISFSFIINSSNEYGNVGDMTNGTPSTWGLMLTLKNGGDTHQTWYEQPSGSVYHRGGNLNNDTKFSAWQAV